MRRFPILYRCSIASGPEPAHRRPSGRIRNKEGFTLAELLVVILIIGILSALALPAISRLTGQNRLESAANMLHAASKLARQHAVANKHPTYLLFSTGQNDPQRAYRSFAVFSINIHAVPVTQDNGYFVQDWQFLPDGIILDPASNPAENLFQAADSGTWQGALNHQNNLLHIDGTTYVTLGFKPNGETASESRHIHLAPGIVHNGQLEIFNPGPGRQIHFTTFGKSMILDTLYGETDGDFRMLGNKKYE